MEIDITERIKKIFAKGYNCFNQHFCEGEFEIYYDLHKRFYLITVDMDNQKLLQNKYSSLNDLIAGPEYQKVLIIVGINHTVDGIVGESKRRKM